MIGAKNPEQETHTRQSRRGGKKKGETEQRKEGGEISDHFVCPNPLRTVGLVSTPAGAQTISTVSVQFLITIFWSWLYTLSLLCDDVITDTPFCNTASRTNTMQLLLLQVHHHAGRATALPFMHGTNIYERPLDVPVHGQP